MALWNPCFDFGHMDRMYCSFCHCLSFSIIPRGHGVCWSCSWHVSWNRVNTLDQLILWVYDSRGRILTPCGRMTGKVLEARMWGCLAWRLAEPKEEGQNWVLKGMMISGVGGGGQRRLRWSLKEEGGKPSDNRTEFRLLTDRSSGPSRHHELWVSEHWTAAPMWNAGPRSHFQLIIPTLSCMCLCLKTPYLMYGWFIHTELTASSTTAQSWRKHIEHTFFPLGMSEPSCTQDHETEFQLYAGGPF